MGIAWTRRRWLRWVALGVAVLAGAVFFVLRIYEPGFRYDVRGVDVSHHQGEIDWEALAGDNVTFAYIKATEGGDRIDPRFHENWRGAADAGVLRGAYHFFTFCRSGADQLANLVATVPTETGMLPPAVDLEFGGNCAARPEVAEFRAELDVFLDGVEAHYGQTPVIYTNAHFYDHYLDESPPTAVWWIQSAFWEPWGAPQWTFWQSWPGRRAGVDGAIDRNVYRSSLEELRGLAGYT